MPTPADPDVLVVGAGPVGLTAACELICHGVRVRLVERRATPVEHSHALVVHVRTQEILDAMGAMGGFNAQGRRLPGMIIRAMGKRIGVVDPSGADSQYPGPLVISQHYTEQILADHFAKLGGQIEREVEAIAFEQDAGGVRVRVRHLAGDASGHEETIAARWLLGCEGTNSLTRNTLNIPFEGERYSGEEFLMVDALVHWSHPSGFGYLFYNAEHAAAFFPFDSEGNYRVLLIRPDADPANKQPPTLDEMQSLIREQADPSLELTNPKWLTRFRTGYRIAARFREGRAFLAGDSGHAHSPIGGQGMNYGMHDAFNLAWKLAAVIKGEAPPGLLDTYEKERRPVDEALVHSTDKAFHAIAEPHPWAVAALKLLGPTMLKLPALQHRLRDTLGELNVTYKESPLSKDFGGSQGPTAGERAPDATVVRWSDRQTIQLFDALRGTHWTLLIFAGEGTKQMEEIEPLVQLEQSLVERYGARLAAHILLTEEPPPAGSDWSAHALMDTEYFAHEKYGVGAAPCFYLVRPDWYIGFRGRFGDADRLRDYFNLAFVN